MMPKRLKTPLLILIHLPEILVWVAAIFMVIASFFHP